MARVVVIEDQVNLLRSITQAFTEANFDAVPAKSLRVAADACCEEADLVVLDLMLPDGSGLDWLREYRAAGNRSYVLILTARDSIDDRVQGLDAGADDYLIKPFALCELMARARAMIRREERSRWTTLAVADLKLDLLARTVVRCGVEIEVPQRQLDLLAFLMRHANSVVTRQMLAEHVWKDSSATWTNVIEVHINQLRKKLEFPGQPVLLHTVRGKGYLLGDKP